MRCSSFDVLLDRYVEATLPPAQMKAVSEHLRLCASCTALLTELRVVDALLATTKSVELAPNFTFAVMAEVRSAPAHAKRTTPLWGVVSIYVGAAWLVLATWFFAGARAPWIAAAGASVRAVLVNTFAAIAGTVHGIGPAGPMVVAIVCAVLIVDAMLAAAVLTFYRTLHPRLAAHLSGTEIP